MEVEIAAVRLDLAGERDRTATQAGQLRRVQEDARAAAEALSEAQAATQEKSHLADR